MYDDEEFDDESHDYEEPTGAMRALLDGKLAIQKLPGRVNANTLLGGIALVVRTEVSRLAHEAFRIGIDAGRLDGIETADQRVEKWVRQLGPAHPDHSPDRVIQIIADGIQRGDHHPTKEEIA